ncbi:MAG: glycosyltransferase [Verrucomicrobiota bacterium]
MRIFLCCQQDLQLHPVPSYRFWRHYFINALTEAGHEVIEPKEIDWAEGLMLTNSSELPIWRERNWEEMLKQIRTEHQKRRIDLFLSYFYPHQIEPSAIEEIQALNIPCVHFFCDNVRDFHKIPKTFHPFDLHWVPEKKALQLYGKANLPHIHLPMPVWIEPVFTSPPENEIYMSVFIGSADALRSQLLAEAHHLGADFTIYGPGWNTSPPQQPTSSQHLGDKLIQAAHFLKEEGPISWYRRYLQSPPEPTLRLPEDRIKPGLEHSHYIQLTRSSSIVIGVNRYPSFRHPFHKPDTYSRLRDIEAPMLGACYLTEWTEGIEELFEPDKEVAYYRNAEELSEKLKDLQSRPEKRMLMRQNAQKRALSEYTIARSIEHIVKELSLSS